MTNVERKIQQRRGRRTILLCDEYGCARSCWERHTGYRSVFLQLIARLALVVLFYSIVSDTDDSPSLTFLVELVYKDTTPLPRILLGTLVLHAAGCRWSDTK